MNCLVKKIWYRNTIVLIVIWISACSPNQNDIDLQNYLSSFDEWKKDRITSLKSPDGWLNLAGLYWLEEGENSIGSDSSNTIIFPANAPAKIGLVMLTDEKLKMIVNQGAEVSNNGVPVHEIDLAPDVSGDPTVLAVDSLAWFIIKRGTSYAIRLRDYNHHNISKLDSIPCFPADLTWKVSATFEPFLQPMMIKVPNILGMVDESPVPGLLKFHIGEQEVTLYPMGSPDHLFLVFGDETSGLETYGGGRFLSVDPPDEEGNYFIDFNKAYNPPCAFTPFATCPLPPKENVLSIRVTAGEKAVEGFGHH